MANKYWTKNHLREVMDSFSADFKNKKYSEKIEYNIWRKMRNIESPLICCDDITTTINIYECRDRVTGNWEKIASFKTNDWGFGRFLYDNYFNEEAKKDMSSISASKLATSSATTTADISYSSTSADSINKSNLSVGTGNDTIKINGSPISSIGDRIAIDDYGNMYWNDGSTYGTTISSVKADKCDMCYHKSKCDNCYYAKKVNENKNDEGEKTKMKGFNFDFGPCTGDQVRMSMYGLAIKNANSEWVSYNDGQVVNVDVLNFDGAKYMFKMPVAVKDIAVGDIVIHNRVPMFVESVENGIHVVDIRAGEKKEILPTTNMFGFNFVTKIVSMFNAFQSSPTPDQPFGNMLPFLMLNGEDGKSMDSDTMIMFMMMQGQTGSANMFSNPMMLYFLMKDKGNSDMLPLMFMMNQSK